MPRIDVAMIDWTARPYTREQFAGAWMASESIAEVGRRLGYTPSGGLYVALRSAANDLGLGEQQFAGQAWRSGSKSPPKGPQPLSEVLVKGRRVSSKHLRRRLIREGILEERCSAPFCPVPNPSVDPFSGETKPLKLVLDHVNGDNADNRIENLRILCYHCHAETPTFGIGAARLAAMQAPDTRPRTRREREILSRPMCACGRVMHHGSTRCRACSNSDRKSQSTIRISPEAIRERLEFGATITAIAEEAGVSRTAIRYYLERNPA